MKISAKEGYKPFDKNLRVSDSTKTLSKINQSLNTNFKQLNTLEKTDQRYQELLFENDQLISQGLKIISTLNY